MTDKKRMTVDEIVESLRAEVTRLTFPSENGGSVPHVLNNIKKALVVYAEQQTAPLLKALEYCALEPGMLQPQMNSQHCVAMNALATYQNQREKK